MNRKKGFPAGDNINGGMSETEVDNRIKQSRASKCVV